MHEGRFKNGKFHNNYEKMENNYNFEAKIQLLFSLVGNGYLKDIRLFKAFLDVNLEEFVPDEYAYHVRFYDDRPALFYHQNDENYRTISAPHMISIMLQGLALKNIKDDLLILGAKSGYIAALAHKLAPEGTITILEANSEVARITTESLEKLNYQDKIKVIVKNPLEGMPDLAPWQKILVTGAIKQERIYPLLDQLDPKEGVLFAPIGEEKIQIYTQILRNNDEFFGRRQLEVRFTPLMTDIELDELELITDFSEFEERTEKDIKKIDNVSIIYTSKIIDDIELEPHPKIHRHKSEIKPRDIVVAFLNFIEEAISDYKSEEDASQCNNYIDNIELLVNVLENFRKKLNLNFRKIKNSINQLKTYILLRQEIASREKSSTNSKILDEKIDIINKQLLESNNLQDIIKDEIKKIEK